MGRKSNSQRQSWEKGKAYNQSGAVTIESVISKADNTSFCEIDVLRGKVKCNFGFVHHPAVAVDRDTLTVLASECDCYESNEDNNICSHCAAIIYANYSLKSKIAVEKNSRISISRLSGDEAKYDFTLKIQKEEVNSFGQREITGKAKCNFGFTHHPWLLLEDGSVKDYDCDCFQIEDQGQLCPHCKALLEMINFGGPEEAADRFEEEMSWNEDTWNESWENNAPENAAGEDEPGYTVPDTELFYKDFPDDIAEPSEDDSLRSEQKYFFADDGASSDDAEAAEAPDLTAAAENKPEPEPEPEPEMEPELEAEPEAEEQPDLQNVQACTTMEVLFGHSDEDGTEMLWCPNDTNCLFHTNTGIIGTMGTGKTQFTKSLVTQLYRQRRYNFHNSPLGILIFDYKGDYNLEHADFIAATHAKVFTPYKMPFNPFDLSGLKYKPLLPMHTASAFADIITKIYNLGDKQNIALINYINEAYLRCGITDDERTWTLRPPTFDLVYSIYAEDDDNKKDDKLAVAMNRLYQYKVFEPDPKKTVSLYHMINGVVVIDLSGYDSSIQSLVVAIMLQLFYTEMQNSGSSKTEHQYRQLRKFILVDEADHFMSEGFTALKNIMKEGREFGVGTILSTQYLKHFVSRKEDYSKYILTWVVHNVPDLTRSEIEYVFHSETKETDALYHEIKGLTKHHSVVKLGNEAPVQISDYPFFELIRDSV